MASPFFVLQVEAQEKAQEKTCTNDTYAWNVNSKSAVNRRSITKPYTALTPIERDAQTGCTVCRQDQRTVTLRNGVTFQMCAVLAPRVESRLNALVSRGVVIKSVTGYRVGLTRGDVDAQGNRTQFSNHSYGISVDINADKNGLYGNCVRFSPQCQLRKGGRWQPNTPEGLHKNAPTVRALKDIGFKWGGEIQGRQKDFMHFSPTGY